ncbi:ubiquitin fusion degradation protein [Aspergillus luchuensis]|uniref:Ubiquitin fusion degradation protein n=1 Tax=Aspergillus kawachii TaxID=1069201 RepID=A0A146FHA8_ASPKA|nr:ubiquitin fusion degradation protein [Aspergillus luchuensis]
MSSGELWSTLVTAIDPGSTKAMPIILQSTIDLLETELAKARAALHEIQPTACSLFTKRDELALGAVAAYRQNLIDRAPDFFYGASRLTPKELGLVPAVREVQADDDEDDHVKTSSKQHLRPVQPIAPKRASLADVLSNSLILDHMAPYLSASSLLALASTSRQVRSSIVDTPYIFRHLDLTQCRGAKPASTSATDSAEQVGSGEQGEDSAVEDEVHSAPLRGIFASLQRQSILQDVRTLVLDGLSVPADLLAEIILTDRFNVNVLSIRECRHLNERKLMQVLTHAVRPSRPKGTPRVKGIYHFTPLQQSRAVIRSRYRDWWSSRCGSQSSITPSPENGSATSEVAESATQQQDAWYRSSGQLFKRSIEDGWAETIKQCEGIIAFDAVLCRGPRHDVDLSTPMPEGQSASQPEGRPPLAPKLATVALGPRGCDGCHTSPEGPTFWGQSPGENLPLLTPPPLHSSSVVEAKRPVLIPDEQPSLIARCTDCLTDRWCHRCNKWFCEDCLPHPERVRNNLSPHQTAFRNPQSNLGSTEQSEDHRIAGNAVQRVSSARRNASELAKAAVVNIVLSTMRDVRRRWYAP